MKSIKIGIKVEYRNASAIDRKNIYLSYNIGKKFSIIHTHTHTHTS